MQTLLMNLSCSKLKSVLLNIYLFIFLRILDLHFHILACTKCCIFLLLKKWYILIYSIPNINFIVQNKKKNYHNKYKSEKLLVMFYTKFF